MNKLKPTAIHIITSDNHSIHFIMYDKIEYDITDSHNPIYYIIETKKQLLKHIEKQ